MATFQKLTFKKDTTGVIISLYIESTSGNGLTGLTNASSGLVCYYFREGDSSATSISLADGTLGSYGSGGDFKEISSANMPGCYQFSIPNAVIATGANNARIMLKGASSMADCHVEIELNAIDYENGRVDLKSTGLDQVQIEAGTPTINARQALSVIGAACAGSTTGADTDNPLFKAMGDDNSTRIDCSLDGSDNRDVTLLPPT